jgi:colanic acid/amylovoran biosynthesis glycosyltransferase
VKELALEDQVQFHGWKSPEEVKQLMQLCDLFILNSRIALDGDSEGLPVGLLEAMAMGMPVISTRHAGIPLAIDDGVNGILVSEHDTDALTQAIKVLLTNEEKRHSIAVAARKKIEERFTIQQMHEKLYEIYSSALDKRQ